MQLPEVKHLPSWFPGTNFKKEGQRGHEMISSYVTRPFEYVRSRMAEGSEQPSFVADILTNSNNLQARKLYSTGDQWLEDVKWAAGGMFGAGVETVRSLRLMLNHESNRIMHSHSLLFWCFTSAWR